MRRTIRTILLLIVTLATLAPASCGRRSPIPAKPPAAPPADTVFFARGEPIAPSAWAGLAAEPVPGDASELIGRLQIHAVAKKRDAGEHPRDILLVDAPAIIALGGVTSLEGVVWEDQTLVLRSGERVRAADLVHYLWGVGQFVMLGSWDPHLANDAMADSLLRFGYAFASQGKGPARLEVWSAAWRAAFYLRAYHAGNHGDAEGREIWRARGQELKAISESLGVAPK